MTTTFVHSNDRATGNRAKRPVAFVLALMLAATAGCSNMTNREQQTLSGGAMGAAGGAAIGGLTGGSWLGGALLGGAAGAAIGAFTAKDEPKKDEKK